MDATRKRKIAAGILIILLIGACETMPQIQSENDKFQKDLIIEESGQRITGLGVLPPKDKYRFQIQSRHNPDIVRISNCHRDVILRDQKKWFTYEYAPNKVIEDGACILQFTFLDEKGYHQFGALSFREPDETIPAMLACNGDIPRQFVGASVCQGKAGTLQVIEFLADMQVKTECDVPKSKDGRSWNIRVSEGFCLFLFKDSKDQFHKLVTYGYNEITKQ